MISFFFFFWLVNESDLPATTHLMDDASYVPCVYIVHVVNNSQLWAWERTLSSLSSANTLTASVYLVHREELRVVGGLHPAAFTVHQPT